MDYLGWEGRCAQAAALSLMDYFRWDDRFAQAAAHAAARAPAKPPTAVPPCARGGSPGMPRRPRMGHGPRAGVRADRRVAWRRGRPASCWNAGRGSGAGGPRRGREPWLSRDNTPEERRRPRNGAVGRTGVPWRGAPRECERSTPKRATASISRGVHSKARYGLESAVVPVRILGHSLLACFEKCCAWRIALVTVRFAPDAAPVRLRMKLFYRPLRS